MQPVSSIMDEQKNGQSCMKLVTRRRGNCIFTVINESMFCATELAVVEKLHNWLSHKYTDTEENKLILDEFFYLNLQEKHTSDHSIIKQVL